MQSVKGWLNLFKIQMNFNSDYLLAKHWQVEQSRITQYRKGRLSLPLAFIIEIAATLEVEPLEIIASIEYFKCRELDKELIHDVYFNAMKKTIAVRMAAYSRIHCRRKFKPYSWRK